MQKPIVGILYHPGESGGEDERTEERHSHELYLIEWDGRPPHIHDFAGITSYDVGHRHRYAGTTGPAPSGVPHTHDYYTITALNQGHTHILRGRTGPAVPLPGGGHYHLFAGVTTVNGLPPHIHRYRGRTGNAHP
ncbi:MAG: YmaF family protein [Kyrpidia sp.]|nr:YmaF family protein [Kyrpidia sp.]